MTIADDVPVTGARVPFSAFPSATAVEWASRSEGAAGELGVTLSGLEEPLRVFTHFEAADFDAAPAYALTPALEYQAGSTWTATFSEPLATLLLYLDGWRGTEGGGDPVDYHFDLPFDIRAGLAEATILGNFGGLVLSLPVTQFHDGILQVQGPLTSLTVTPDSSSMAVQGLAMAVVPVPQFRAIDWVAPQAGSAGATEVALTGLGLPELAFDDLSGADFATARLSNQTEIIDCNASSDWVATFSEPIEGLLVYLREWGDGSYRFDAPFTILAGLDGAGVSDAGRVLTIPPAGTPDGILHFGGPLAGLAVDASPSAAPRHALTLAVVPEADAMAAGLAALGALVGLARRAR